MAVPVSQPPFEIQLERTTRSKDNIFIYLFRVFSKENIHMGLRYNRLKSLGTKYDLKGATFLKFPPGRNVLKFKLIEIYWYIPKLYHFETKMLFRFCGPCVLYYNNNINLPGPKRVSFYFLCNIFRQCCTEGF